MAKLGRQSREDLDLIARVEDVTRKLRATLRRGRRLARRMEGSAEEIRAMIASIMDAAAGRRPDPDPDYLD